MRPLHRINGDRMGFQSEFPLPLAAERNHLKARFCVMDHFNWNRFLMLCMSSPCFGHASTSSAQSGTPSKIGQWPQAEQTSRRAGRGESDQPQSTVGDNKATAPNERVAMSSPRWHQRGERNSSACSRRAQNG